MRETKTIPGFNRCLGLREAITITAGTVIGVGLFTVGANVVGLMGPTVIFATLAALLISIYPSMLYAEMAAALPYSGGTYQYASQGLGRPFGMLSGWCFVISMVSVASGEALAFSFYLRTLLEALGLSLPISDTWIAVCVVAGFLLLSVYGVEMTGRLQNGFLFFFWGVAIVWILSILPSLHLDAENAIPYMDQLSLAGFLPCVAMIWWCFAGFETCCAMGEEIRHPQINLPRALILAPFLVFAVTGLFQWALLGIVPSDALAGLAEAAAPYADSMRLAGITGFPLVLLSLGIAFGGDFSTLNASICAPARYLFSMAKDGALPRFLAVLHPRYRTPVPAILILGGLMLLLIATNSISLIASLSLFATLFYYILGIASACGLRIRQPGLHRPYRAPLLWVGAPASILVYLLLMAQLDYAAILAGAAWCLLGLLLFRVCRRRRGSLPPNPLAPNPIPPDCVEKKRMDREFRLWCVVVAAAVLAALGLHLALLL